MAAKPLDTVSRRPEKIHRFLMFLFHRAAFLAGHVPAVFRPQCLVKQRWIITAVKIDIGLHKKMVGKQPPAVSQQNPQHIIGAAAFTPGRRARLQAAGKPETTPSEEQHYHDSKKAA